MPVRMNAVRKSQRQSWRKGRNAHTSQEQREADGELGVLGDSGIEGLGGRRLPDLEQGQLSRHGGGK